MARIRTIKPEFPQSENMGRLSRDARLLFIQLWTIADDAGRMRGASRLLASLLYPYDDDAGDLIDGWLSELEQKTRIRRYEVEGSQYIEIVNWLKHQKIDKPSKSRLPSPDNPREVSRAVAEASATDLGPSTTTLDLGPRTTDPKQEKKLNGHSTACEEKKKPRHGATGKEHTWFDRGTDEWKAHAEDYRLARGKDPPLQYGDSGTWFKTLGENSH